MLIILKIKKIHKKVKLYLYIISFLKNQKVHLRSEVFGHAGLLNERSASFFQATSIVSEQTRSFDLRCYVGYLVLHALE